MTTQILVLSTALMWGAIGDDTREPIIPRLTPDSCDWGTPNRNDTGTLAVWSIDAICPEGDAAVRQLQTDNPTLTARIIDYTPDWQATLAGWLPPS